MGRMSASYVLSIWIPPQDSCPCDDQPGLTLVFLGPSAGVRQRTVHPAREQLGADPFRPTQAGSRRCNPLHQGIAETFVSAGGQAVGRIVPNRNSGRGAPPPLTIGRP
jgi:hypothetical protein